MLNFLTFLALTTTMSYGTEKTLFSGDIGVSNRTFLETNDEDIYSFTGRFKYKNKITKNLGYIVQPHLRLSRFENSNGHLYFLRGNDTGLYFTPKKGWLLSGGLLSHQFGFSQLFSPINFVDTASYWSPLAPESISSPAIRLLYRTSKIKAFLSYMPLRFENLYPGTESPWIPRKTPDSLEIDNNTLIFPNQAEYRVDDSIDLNSSLKNNFVAGLRLKLDPFLTQIILYDGVNTDPNAILNLNLNLLDADVNNQTLEVENPIAITPTYQRVTRVGFGLRYTLPFKWRLVYEGNYTRAPEAGQISSNPLLNIRTSAFTSQTHTVGLEWGVPIGETLLVGVVQAYRSERENDSSLGFVSPFKEAYLYGLDWKRKSLKLQAGLLNSASLDIKIYTLEASVDSFKNLTHSVSYLRLEGDVTELINGLFDKDSLLVKTTYKF